MFAWFRKKYRIVTVFTGEVEIALGHWPGRGPTVLCLHGLTANHKCWTRQAEFLQKNGFDVYAMDLRGRGRSAKPKTPYGVDVHVRDAVGVLRKLGKLHCLLLCHSYGCNVGVRMAAGNPGLVRGMVLMDGGGVLTVPQKLRILGVLGPSFKRLLGTYPDEASYLQALKDSPFISSWDPLIEEHFLYEIEAAGDRVRCNIPPSVIESEMSSMGGSMLTGRTFRKLLLRPGRFLKRSRRNNNPPYAQIQAPVLIMRAGHFNLDPGDDLLPRSAVRRMEAEIPDARSVEFPGANHYGILVDDLPEREPLIFDFFRSATGRAGS